MVIYKDKLISCSNDKTIKIWDLNLEGKRENIKPIKTLEGHTDRVIHMVIYKDKLISCSFDKTIKIWNLDLEGENNRCIRTLEGHTNCVLYMVVYKDKLISGSGDNTVKIWDLEGENIRCIRTLEDQSDWIDNMVIYRDKLIICSEDRTVKICDLKEADNLNQLTITYNMRVSMILFYNGYLYACNDNTIKILKYQPYFEDYQKAMLTVFKIMNTRDILFRNELYIGKLYIREVKLLMDMCDNYNNTVITNT